MTSSSLRLIQHTTSLEVCVAALRPPAAWLTSDPAGPLTVRDRDCPQRLAVNLFFLLIYPLISCGHACLLSVNMLRSDYVALDAAPHGAGSGCCGCVQGPRAGFGSPAAIKRGCHETVRGGRGSRSSALLPGPEGPGFV